ncbi:MAG: 6-bladed beta-propeller [Tannerella sp.]|jgi:hypothetical protein|nr:6-bladed beta-propeller [Tannerella sp.]
MKKILIAFTFFVVCLFSKCTCSSDSTNSKGTVNNDGEILTLKFNFDETPVNIHDIGLISDVEILNLDCEEAIFGEISKIIRHKNRIYILDKRQTYSVIIYDTLGNFVNLIDKHGQGPNEYIQLSDIFINPDDETLNLVSRTDRKILKHDLNGNLIKVEKMPKMFSNLLKVKDGYLGDMANTAIYEKNSNNVWTLSNKLELKDGFFEIDPTWESSLIAHESFSQYKDKTYYTTFLDFNVYSIKNGKCSVAYTFDFGKHTWPKEYIEYDKYKSLRKDGDGWKLYINQFDHFQETQLHLIAEVIYNPNILLCVYNKQTGKTYIAKEETYKDKYVFPFGKIVGVDEKAIYTLLNASQVKPFWVGKNQYVDFESKYPEQVKRLREKFSHIDEEGNPFLVIYSIK